MPLALLAACGSVTGELPATGDAGRTPAAFADPVTGPALDPFADAHAAAPVPAAGTAAGEASTRPPLPLFATATPPLFADGAGEDAAVFATPDPDAATLLARLGHAALRELVEPLVTARYVDAYLDLDDAVFVLLAPEDGEVPGETRTPACPDGGRLDVSAERAAGGTTHDIVFHDCALAGATLNGRLARTALTDGFRLGANEAVELDYVALRVERDPGDGNGWDSVTLTGATRWSVARRADTECGGEGVERVIAHRVESAALVRDGVTERVTGAEHALVRESVPTRADAGDCRERVTLVFDGDATVSGGRFGRARATLRRDGRIVRDARGDREPPARASLGIAIDDGSRLSLELLSDRDGTARVDAFADGAAVSFTTRYRFEE